jgi:hypothetical protein
MSTDATEVPQELIERNRQLGIELSTTKDAWQRAHDLSKPQLDSISLGHAVNALAESGDELTKIVHTLFWHNPLYMPGCTMYPGQGSKIVSAASRTSGYVEKLISNTLTDAERANLLESITPLGVIVAGETYNPASFMWDAPVYARHIDDRLALRWSGEDRSTTEPPKELYAKNSQLGLSRFLTYKCYTHADISEYELRDAIKTYVQAGDELAKKLQVWNQLDQVRIDGLQPTSGRAMISRANDKTHFVQDMVTGKLSESMRNRILNSREPIGYCREVRGFGRFLPGLSEIYLNHEDLLQRP